MNLFINILVLLLMLATTPALGQPVPCNLTTGCLVELDVTQKGTYTTYRVDINEVGQPVTPLTFAIVVPKTLITPAQLGITQQISGVIIHFDGTLKIIDAATQTVLKEEILKVESGGTPVPQTFDVRVCAQSSTEADICTPTISMVAT